MTSDSESVLSVRGCLKVIGVLVLLTIVVMVALFVLTRSTAEWVIEGIGQGIADLKTTIADIPQSVANAVRDMFKSEERASLESRDLLLLAVNYMAFLETASYSTSINVSTGVRSGLLNACGKSVDFLVEGTVEAGVDLGQIQGSDITYDLLTNNWTLELGPAAITSCRIDYSKFEGQTFTLPIVCQQDIDELRLLAESKAVSEFRELALDEGLPTMAQQEAELVLGNLLSAVTGSDNVTIVFESEPEVDLPESCLREPPVGWKFDEGSESWVQE